MGIAMVFVARGKRAINRASHFDIRLEYREIPTNDTNAFASQYGRPDYPPNAKPASLFQTQSAYAIKTSNSSRSLPAPRLQSLLASFSSPYTTVPNAHPSRHVPLSNNANA